MKNKSSPLATKRTQPCSKENYFLVSLSESAWAHLKDFFENLPTQREIMDFHYPDDSDPIDVYWAGALFNTKDLIYNSMMAKYINWYAFYSSGRNLRIILPQDLERDERQCLDKNPWDIRIADYVAVVSSGLGLVNFEESGEQDMGTVAEGEAMTSLFKRKIQLRTSFLQSGDVPGELGASWNLMCMYDSEDSALSIDALRLYQEVYQSTADILERAHRMLYVTASLVVDEFERLINLPSPSIKGGIVAYYENFLRNKGKALYEQICPEGDTRVLRNIVKKHIRHGLYNPADYEFDDLDLNGHA